jgi:hypothetical protein
VQAVPLIFSIRLLFLAFRPKPHSENPSFQFCEQQTSKYALGFEVYLHRSLGLLCFTLGVGMAVVTCPISYTSQSKSKNVKQCPTIAQNFSMKTLLIGHRFNRYTPKPGQRSSFLLSTANAVHYKPLSLCSSHLLLPSIEWTHF